MTNPIIAFEGIDFAGKSTILKMLEEHYPSEIAYIHEPGGTDISEKIATILADDGRHMHRQTKTLLFEAARNELIHNRIQKEIQNRPVILDRFVASTLAYQVYGDHQKLETIQFFNNYVLDGLELDATFLFKITEATMLSRKNIRSEKVDDLDKYHNDYYRRVQDNYYKAISQTPTKEIITIDSNKEIYSVYTDVAMKLQEMGIIQ